jgi:hypothetical protein
MRVLDPHELFGGDFAAGVPRLYAAGDVTLLGASFVAIVGSRRASPEGLRRAYQLARDLARHGVVVLSGLAEGIDRAAHESALEHGGRTVAVVGTPLDRAYPAANAALQVRAPFALALRARHAHATGSLPRAQSRHGAPGPRDGRHRGGRRERVAAPSGRERAGRRAGLRRPLGRRRRATRMARALVARAFGTST